MTFLSEDPDLNQPKLPIRDVFTLRDAAMLWCGEDPAEATWVISEMQQEVEVRMQLAIEAGTLKVAKFITGPEYDPRWVNGQEGFEVPEMPIWEDMLLTRDDLLQWATRNGYVPPFLMSDQPVHPDAKKNSYPLPFGYSTEALEVMAKAIEEFWLDWAPGKPSAKRETIINWIRDQGVSESAAEGIDLIIRPDNHPHKAKRIKSSPRKGIAQPR